MSPNPLWRDIYNFKVNFCPSHSYHQKSFFFSIIWELLSLMLTKVLIRVDCRFFFTQPEKVCIERHNFDPSLRPWGGFAATAACLGARFASSCLGATVLQSWVFNCFANAFCPPHFLQTGKPGLANKRLIVSVQMERWQIGGTYCILWGNYTTLWLWEIPELRAFPGPSYTDQI